MTLKPKAVQKILDQNSTSFVVRSTYPDEDKIESLTTFNSYAGYAFIHKDVATQLVAENRCAASRDRAIWTHREMFRDHIVAEPGEYTGYVTDALIFTLASDAFRVAEFIAEHCRLISGYSHNTEWEKKHRGVIRTRVVLVQRRVTEHVVIQSN
jgi:hypothetical protein